MADGLTLSTVYRRAYGHVRDRLDRLSIAENPAALVIDPAEAAGWLDVELAGDPQILDVIRRAIDDAREGRRPAW